MPFIVLLIIIGKRSNEIGAYATLTLENILTGCARRTEAVVGRHIEVHGKCWVR